MNELTYDKWKFKSPYFLALLVVIIAFLTNQEELYLGVFSVALAWFCSSPNYNLGDGCLVQVCGVFAIILGLYSFMSFYTFAVILWLSWLIICHETEKKVQSLIYEEENNRTSGST